MMITSAEEFKQYIESESEEENGKALDSAPDEVWFDVLLKYPLCHEMLFLMQPFRSRCWSGFL
jgi:hypothetical protein